MLLMDAYRRSMR